MEKTPIDNCGTHNCFTDYLRYYPYYKFKRKIQIIILLIGPALDNHQYPFVFQYEKNVV